MERKDYLNSILQQAKKAGAAQADAILSTSREISANIYQRELEQYEDASTCGVGLRVFLKDGRVGYAYTESLTRPEELAAQAIAVAEVCDADADAILYQGPFPASPASAKFELPPEREIISTAHGLYEEMVACPETVDTYRSIVGVETAEQMYMSTAGADLRSGWGTTLCVAIPVVGHGEYREMGADYGVAARLCDLNLSAVARKAVERGMRYNGAAQTSTRTCPVIFHGEAMIDLLETFVPAFSGKRALEGLSLLRGKEGEPIAAPCVTLKDSPYNPLLQTLTTFDGEGVPVQERNLVENGVLQMLMYDVKTAKKAGVMPTGHAVRGYRTGVGIGPHNLSVQPGEKTLEQLAQEAINGVLIYEVSGLHAGANAVSGDFSLLCKGREIANGEIQGPFTQAVVSGNFYSMLKQVIAIGNEVELSPPAGRILASPAVLVEAAIAGA